MTPLQSPRGTRDILPTDQLVWEHVRETCVYVARNLNYQSVTLPTFEETALFQRSLGEGTDIIDKEMFLVSGRSDEASTYALRPEGTAGMVRAFIQNGMQSWPQPVKLYSILNLFRYERPQRGRYREHVQFDIEYFGDGSAFSDAWVILTQWQVLKRLGISGVKLEINTLGTPAERNLYNQTLVDYLRPLTDRLSTDSQRRLDQNPLRILDSKDAGDQELIQNAPTLRNSLSPETLARLEAVCAYLQAWEIPFRHNPLLVRGLDYYSHTCFEWVHLGADGKSLSVGGGGRYDALVPQLGGPDVGAVGAGLGLDRIVELISEIPPVKPPDAYIILADALTVNSALRLLADLIAQGIALDADFSKPSLGAQLKAAGRRGARFAIIIGSRELDAGQVAVKDLTTGKQELIAIDALASHLR